MDKKQRLLLTFFGLNVLDLLSTLFLYLRGDMVEGNPLYELLLSIDTSMFCVVKLSAAVITTALLSYRSERTRWVLELLVPYFAGLITWQSLTLLMSL